MNIIELIRLFMQIWPFIEQILNMIDDEKKRKEAEAVVAKAFGDILKAVA